MLLEVAYLAAHPDGTETSLDDVFRFHCEVGDRDRSRRRPEPNRVLTFLRRRDLFEEIERQLLHRAAISAAHTVFSINIAIVIGPTPPGTGVIFDATSRTPSKSTSPRRRVPDFELASETRFVPTSITTAPRFTRSRVIIPGLPAATIRMSASRVCPPRCSVC